MIKKNLPIYDIIFDEENGVFQNVSLVDVPAIRRDFIQLSRQEMLQLKINEENRIVSGPALIPDQLVYRKDGNEEFYIRFSADTIKKMALNFFHNGRQNEGNLMHCVPVNDITFFESYLINKERGIAPVEFADLPDGTWILSAKINNDEVWELVKNGTLNGFSISAKAGIEPEKKTLDTLQDLLDYIKS